MQINYAPVTNFKSLSENITGIILIDLSWVLHKSYHTFDKLSVTINEEKVNTGPIFGVLKTIQQWATLKPDHAIILCQDMWSSAENTISSDYKSNRTYNPDVYRLVQETIAAAHLSKNVYIAFHPGREADSHIFSLSQKFARDNVNVIIFGSDKDFLQCLTSDYVSQVTKIDKGIPLYTTKKDVMEKMGVEAHQVPMFRALTGDSSDNLKGYFRFPSKLAAILATHFETPEELLNKHSNLSFSDSQKRWIDLILANPEILKTNFSLMRLVEMENEYVFETDRNHHSILTKYNLKSFAKFIEPNPRSFIFG